MPQLELDFFVNLIAHVVEALLYENDLVHIIQLRKDCGGRCVPDRIKELENHDHEVLVLLTLPGVEAKLVAASVVLDREILLEFLKEVHKQELRINLALHELRKLAEQA